MRDKEILKELLLDACVVPLDEEYGKPIIKLEEVGVAGAVTCIRNIPSDVIAIKADAFPAPNSFFKGDKGECKRADFILISEERKVVLFVEIKAGAKDAGHIVRQLKGAACLLAYCKEIGKKYWGREEFLDDYAHRYIGIVNLSVSKKPTRHRNSPVNDTPEQFQKISSPHNLQFKQLVAL